MSMWRVSKAEETEHIMTGSSGQRWARNEYWLYFRATLMTPFHINFY